MGKRQRLEDLNVLDDFMLNAIANDPDVGEVFFQEVLSVLLERDIGEVTVKAQSVIPGDTPELRGIRLDVEIQEKDSKRLKRGEKNWDKLPDLYMIMITTFDPFGKGGMIYTFENTCKEYPDVENKDGLKYIYFNTTGTKGGTKSIKQLLSYLKHSKIENVTNEKISHIHEYVEAVKQSAEVRDRYMTIGEMLDASRAEGRLEGSIDMCIRFVKKGVITLSEAASQLGMTEEEIAEKMQETTC